MIVQPFDREALRRRFASAKPFPFIEIEDFLDLPFANKVATAYPTFKDAAAKGFAFNALNERKKIQITDVRLFPEPVVQLHEALASPAFLADLYHIAGIPDLLAEEEVEGGGMHITGPGGRLDVHVDFNYLKDRRLYRRLNLLIYLNPVWDQQWGGDIQLWDKDVKSCQHAFVPMLNRCLVFETSDHSFHGVIPVAPDAPYPRISFAAYYYTREAPANWKGSVHSTVFKARPHERFRGYVLMPAQLLQRRIMWNVHWLKQGVKKLISS